MEVLLILVFIVGLGLGFALRGAISREMKSVKDDFKSALDFGKAEDAKMRQAMLNEYKLLVGAVRAEKAKVADVVAKV